ncbi:enhancer of filamentation 1-like isoform X2 [Heterodontus francisci]|uniref:enhancer of filamentation 1-like isoform X2 n=1 Tax=Heterodontus francisci TaxID=7792 RepID=UPI00355C9734
MAEVIGSTTTGDLNSQNLMAKALYDNKAETPDELAFRKGDILTVIEQNVKGDEGWWRCSLHGRQGIAPGNRLQLLTGSQYDIPSLYSSPYPAQHRSSQQNIYQTPANQHQSLFSTPVSGSRDNVYQVPTTPQSHSQIYQVPKPSAEFHANRRQAPPSQVCTLPSMGQVTTLTSMSGPYADAYDIPTSHVPGIQYSQMSGSPRIARKYSMFQTEAEKSLIQQQYDFPLSFERPRVTTQQQVYDVPPSVCRDGPKRDDTYDIPPSYGREPLRVSIGPYCTLPPPRKLSWDQQDGYRVLKQGLYDVPASRDEAAFSREALYDIPPTKGGAGGSNLPYGTLPSRLHTANASQPVYDIPPSKNGSSFNQSLYDIPPSREHAASNQGNRLSKFSEIYDIPVNVPKPNQDWLCQMQQNIYDLPRTFPPAGFKDTANARNLGEPLYDVPPQVSRDVQTTQERADSSTAEGSKSDAPTTSGKPPVPAVPESAQEITLDVELATGRLMQLQQQVTSSVASIMAFVSSKWRLQDHLEEHLTEIHSAADNVMKCLGTFMDFVRGVKVNATRLTDSNLQNRLYKQLQILEDSYHIMVETSQALSDCSWSLSVLVVSKPQAIPDDLDRFVMVTRTIPDDVKRLESIIIANAKLLFNQAQRQEGQRQQQTPSTLNKQPTINDTHPRLQRKPNGIIIKQKAPLPTPPRREHNLKPRHLLTAKPNHIEDCDYVQLQRKEEFERQEKEKESVKQKEKESFKQKKLLLERQMTEAKIRKPGDSSVKVNPNEIKPPTSGSEECKMYFNSLHKAIVSFTDNANGNQSSDILIKHSKVVIMMGQKLVDVLCRETGQKNVHKVVLRRSNQFCGQMKKFAVATKNAVLQPNPIALQEMKDQVAELSQQAEQLRLLLEQATAL